MKKFFVLTLAALTLAGAVNAQELTKEQKAALKAQQKELNGFLKEAKKKSTSDEFTKPDVAAARAAIQSAAKNPLSEGNAEFYLIAGNVETAAWMEAANKQDFPSYAASAKAGFEYYKKAYAAATKAEKVDGKMVAEAQKGALNLYQQTAGLAMIGNVYYQEKDFRACLEAFQVAKVAYKEPVLTSNPLAAAILPIYSADSTISNLSLNCFTVAQYQLNDTAAAITELVYLKDHAENDDQLNQVLQSLALDYYGLDDTIKFENTLKEGVKRLPNESWYVNNLINIYIGRKDYASASSFLDKAIASDPKNVSLLSTKGQLLEEEGKVDDALTFYNKAYEIDPSSVTVNSALGRYYYNRALAVEDEYYQKKKFDEGDRQAAPFYEKSLPYYEAAFLLDDERKDKGIGIALRTLYARQMAKGGAKKATFTQKYEEVKSAYGL